MHPIQRFALASAALAIAVQLPAARAQGEWNRRISDVRIVHPPGTPPGTWRVDADIEVTATDDTPQPVVLDCDVQLLLNGTPIDTQPLGATLASALNCAGAPCGGQCGPWSHIPPYPPYPGNCRAFVLHSGAVACACLGKKTFTYGPYGGSQSTDLITVTTTSSPGSLPEIDTSDDSRSMLVSDNNPGTVFCAGDGTLPTACPCSNYGIEGHGCSNSSNPNGALLTVTGFTEPDPSGLESMVLHGSGMPATSPALYLKSNGHNSNGVLFGDGVRCVSGTLIRLRTKINVGGQSRFPEPGDPSLSVKGGTPPGSGITAYYQIYYRNAGDYCAPGTFNMSNGVSVVW
jgi:hypothetical protein